MFGSGVLVAFVTVLALAMELTGNQLDKEMQSPRESLGGETEGKGSEEFELEVIIQNAVGHNTHGGQSAIPSSKLMNQSNVTAVKTTSIVVRKSKFSTIGSSREGTSSRHSSSERNRQAFPTVFRWATEQEKTTASPSAHLAPRLSSLVHDATSNRISSSPSNRLFTRTSRSEPFATTSRSQGLWTKQETRSSLFTEKTILLQGISSSSFALRNTNIEQANHASVLGSAGSSLVTSPLSRSVVLTRQTVPENVSSQSMQPQTTKRSTGQKHPETTVLIRESSVISKNQASVTMALRDLSVKSFRSTPSVGQTLREKSRNQFHSSRVASNTPYVAGHGISTAVLRKLPVLSSSAAVTDMSGGSRWTPVNSLRGTTDDAVSKTSDFSSTEMVGSIMVTPSGAQIESEAFSREKRSVEAGSFIWGRASSPLVAFSSPATPMEEKKQSEVHYSSRQDSVINSTSSSDGTSGVNSLFSSTVISGRESSTLLPEVPHSSPGLLQTSYAKSIASAASSYRFSRAQSKLRRLSKVSLSAASARAPISAPSPTSTLFVVSKEADIRSSKEAPQPSASRSLVVSSSREESPGYTVLFQTSQSGDFSTSDTRALVSPSEYPPGASSLKLVRGTLQLKTPTMSQSKPQLSRGATSVPETAVQSEMGSKSSATVPLRPTEDRRKTSVQNSATILSTMPLDSQKLSRGHPSLSEPLSSSTLNIDRSNAAPSSSFSHQAVKPTRLKSSALIKTTRPSAVDESSTGAVQTSPTKGISSAHANQGPHSLTPVTTTLGATAVQSSDRVILATSSPQSSSPVLISGPPATGSVLLPSNRTISRSTATNKNVGQTSAVPKPYPTPSSSPSLAVPAPSASPAPKLKTNGSGHMPVLIVVATVPSVLLGIIIGILICRYHRGRSRHKSAHYSIKVEYTDDVRRRPRKRANSRLDLAVHGIHIDLEFPNAADMRDSVRISRGTHLSEGQIRELQLLSHECNQKLEWLNEVLAKEVPSPFNGTESGVLFRDGALDSGGKIVRRESSKRSRDNFFLKRLLSRERDSIVEAGEETRKEAIECKPLSASDSSNNDATCESLEHAECDTNVDEPQSPKCETLATDLKSAGETDSLDQSPQSPGNKMRYYPLARTRKESTRLRFETM